MAIDCSTAEMAADEIDRLTSEIASLTARCEVLRGVVAAWEMLPSGHYGASQIDRWLREDMKPAIDAARAALQSSGEARTAGVTK